MSEYQRYEFMVADRPLSRGELEEVRRLSSHIEASSSHAIIEYHWGDFKHEPIEVLRQFFDGFLYWANWGAPQLAFRFPRGVLPANLLDGYDLEDCATFTRHPECDILDIHFGEMTAEQKKGLMARARWKARDNAPAKSARLDDLWTRPDPVPWLVRDHVLHE